MNLREKDISEFSFNPFTKIGKEWMLISACDEKRGDKKINTMTASWGGVGVLWGKNVFFCFVRPQRFTKEFIDAQDTVTLSFFDEKYRDALTICGRRSGRDSDKITDAGLCAKIRDGAVFFDEARLTVVGKKLFAQELDEKSFIDPSLVGINYPAKDFHTMYVCEITGVYESIS